MRFIDMHTDTAQAIYWENQHLEQNHLHVDLVRSQGEFTYVPFLTLWADSSERDMKGLYEKMRTNLENEMKGKAAFVKTVSDYRKTVKEGMRPALFAVEGAELFECDAERLPYLKEHDSLLMTGIAWNNPNKLVVMGEGLTEEGKKFVRRCGELGIVADVSHLNDIQTAQVLALTDRVVASHSDARALCDVPRNLPDALIRAIGHQGGLMGLNFCSIFVDLTEEKRTMRRLAEHAAHMAELAGVGALAVGTDLDGCSLPNGAHGVEDMPMLAEALSEVGFSRTEIEDITFNNACRYFLGGLPEETV